MIEAFHRDVGRTIDGPTLRLAALRFQGGLIVAAVTRLYRAKQRRR